MAGSKAAAGKKKKQHNSVSQEAKDVQAWVASAPTGNVEQLIQYVVEKRTSSSSRLVLLGALYLLLKRPGLAKAMSNEPASRAAQINAVHKQKLLKLLDQLVQEAVELVKSATATADGDKSPLVLVWATVEGLHFLADNAEGLKNQQYNKQLISICEQFVQTSDPQQYLEQWDGPSDYPAPVEAGTTAEQVVAELGSDIVRDCAVTKMRMKEQDAGVLLALLKDMKVSASAACDVSKVSTWCSAKLKAHVKSSTPYWIYSCLAGKLAGSSVQPGMYMSATLC
jgi:hypothetical protein